MNLYSVASVHRGLLAFIYTELFKGPGTTSQSFCSLMLFFWQPFWCRFAAERSALSSCTSQFVKSFSHQTDGLIFNFRIFWYTEEFTIDSMIEKNRWVWFYMALWPLWSHLSKVHCSRSLFVQIPLCKHLCCCAVLTCSF